MIPSYTLPKTTLAFVFVGYQLNNFTLTPNFLYLIVKLQGMIAERVVRAVAILCKEILVISVFFFRVKQEQTRSNAGCQW